MAGIKGTVISLERGYEHVDGLKAVRIVSKTYNILIMADYVPIIGEVKGSVALIANDGTARLYDKVHGFYRHSKNEFTFLLEGKYDPEEEFINEQSKV